MSVADTPSANSLAKLNLLSDPECKNATAKGNAIRKLHDGGGLYLWVYADGRPVFLKAVD